MCKLLWPIALLLFIINSPSLNAQNVGIGFNTPLNKLDIYSAGTSDTTETVLALISDISKRPVLQFSELYPATPNSGMSIEYEGLGLSGDFNKLHIRGVDAQRKFTFMSFGYMGIRVTEPNEPLEVGFSGRVFIGDGADTARTGLLIDGNEPGDYVRLHPYDYGTNQNLDLFIPTQVGIGTQTPDEKLHVEGGNIKLINPSRPWMIFDHPSSALGGGLQWWVDGNVEMELFYDDVNQDLRFWDTQTGLPRLILQRSGNLGIGSGIPTSALEVNGEIELGGNSWSTIKSRNDTSQFRLFSSYTYYRGAYILANSAGTNLNPGSLWITHGDFTSPAPPSFVRFRYANNGVITTQMILTDAGNVGIGTITPTEKLDVAGGTRIDGTTFVVDETNHRVGIGIPDPVSTLEVAGSLTVDNNTFVVDDINGRVGIGTFTPGKNLEVVGGAQINATTFVVDEINNRVGIGTSTPGEKLDVAGGTVIDGTTFVVDDINNRVGIGTSTPSYALDVEGSASIGGHLLRVDEFNNRVGIGTLNPQTGFHISNGDVLIETSSASSGTQLAISAFSQLSQVIFQNDGAFGASVGYDLAEDRLFLYEGGNIFVKSGNLGIGVAPANKIDVVGGAHCTGTNWVNASSRKLKENIRTIDYDNILDRLEQIPITEWNYISEGNEIKHIGPMAEDFFSVFGLGADVAAISTVDVAGVSLAAIKALRAENDQLKAENARIKDTLANLLSRVEQLERTD